MSAQAKRAFAAAAPLLQRFADGVCAQQHNAQQIAAVEIGPQRAQQRQQPEGAPADFFVFEALNQENEDGRQQQIKDLRPGPPHDGCGKRRQQHHKRRQKRPSRRHQIHQPESRRNQQGKRHDQTRQPTDDVYAPHNHLRQPFVSDPFVVRRGQ
jgi:hypothetical protein